MRVVVLSDTHAPRRWRACPPRVAEHLRGADLILHAGDVCTARVLEELTEYAPVVAVLGNNDDPDVARWGAAETAELDLDGPGPGEVLIRYVAAGLCHSDLHLTDGDLVLALSYSGETTEVLNILPALKRFDVRMIAFTGDPQSTRVRQARSRGFALDGCNSSRAIIARS